EAAFITGLERNAEVVHLTSYAPLMAHADGWQWTPDMIWFNNLESYGTPNYYVQKLFSTNKGTDLLTITENNKPITGQKELYASAVKDLNSKEVIIKLVNTSETEKKVTINLQEKVSKKATLLILSSDAYTDENSFKNTKKISPITKNITIKENPEISVSKHSLTILKIKMK